MNKALVGHDVLIHCYKHDGVFIAAGKRDLF